MSGGVLLSDDFLFISKIQGAARAQGLDMRVAKSTTALLDQVQSSAPACVLLDLNVAGREIGALVARLKAQSPAPSIVGYGSHVDVETLKAARAAGCDVVLPRSVFVEQLETALPHWHGVRTENRDDVR